MIFLQVVKTFQVQNNRVPACEPVGCTSIASMLGFSRVSYLLASHTSCTAMQNELLKCVVNSNNSNPVFIYSSSNFEPPLGAAYRKFANDCFIVYTTPKYSEWMFLTLLQWSFSKQWPCIQLYKVL